MHSPVLSVNCCRLGSEDGDASSPAGLEAAGLYWRKHRLPLPQGYTMTATQAQAASSHPAADHQDVTHDDTASIGSSEAQQDAHLTSTVQEQPSAAALQAKPCGVTTADLGVGEGWVNDYDSLAATDVLIIEDAAELTSDRAAVILRQLSCECQAVDNRHKSDAACSPFIAEQEQQTHVPEHQAKADCPVASCSNDATSAVAAVTAGTLPSSAILLDSAEVVAEGAGEHMSGSHGRLSTPSSAFGAAGVDSDAGRGLPPPDGQTSSSNKFPSACLNAASLQATGGRDALQDVVCSSMELGPDQSPASTTQPAAPQQGASGSSFLQRLQMSKHADVSGSLAASHQSEERRHGEQPGCTPCQSSPNLGTSGLCQQCKLVETRAGVNRLEGSFDTIL